MKKLLLGAVLATLSLSSYAQLLEIDLVCSGGSGLTQAQCDTLESNFQTEINKEDVPELPIGDFADQMANAVSISSAGTGSDYANLFDIFIVGFHPLALGADIDLSDIDNVDSAGIALAPSVMVGVNLDLLPIDKIGSVELKDFDLFFSYFSQSDDKLYDEDGTTIGGEISNFSTHIRYRWLADKSALGGLFRWNGVQVHTGYRYAKNKLDIAYNLGTVDSTPVDSGGAGDFNLGLSDAITTASIESTSHTIPLEISTSGRALYFLTMYAGLGLDYNITSKSEIDVTASGNLVDTDSRGISGSVKTGQNADGEGAATNFRGMFGVQFDILNFKINTGVQKSLSNDTIALNVGAKFAW